MLTKPTFYADKDADARVGFISSYQSITNIGMQLLPCATVSRLCQRPKFRKVAAGTDLLIGGHVRMCGPTYPARH
jgi:hypothetical protein